MSSLLLNTGTHMGSCYFLNRDVQHTFDITVVQAVISQKEENNGSQDNEKDF